MHLIFGNLFLQSNFDAVCITTNGFVKTNGEAVMGRGSAKEATMYFPELPKILGTAIKNNGNTVNYLLSANKTDLWSFPVKTTARKFKDDSEIVDHMKAIYEAEDIVPGWAFKADLKIIEESAIALKQVADVQGYKKILLPRPGCGAGELTWPQVAPVLSDILDQRFYIITFGETK